MASAVMTPAAYAEPVEVMILNIRGDDGIYRVALRIIRGGDVEFIDAFDNDLGLTEAILRDRAALGEWLGANVQPTDTGGPVEITLTEIQSDRPQAAGPKVCFTEEDGKQDCDEDKYIAFCSYTFPDEFKYVSFYSVRDYCGVNDR